MKLGFVTPWFGFNIPGGAEAELRGLATHLNQTDVEVEILTTCVKDFNSNWSENFHPEGETIENGLVIRRFKVDRRNKQKFDLVNLKLMKKIPLTPAEQQVYIDEMVNSKALYEYLENNQDNYDLFVFIPYMFGTTYNGIKINPKKSVLIPCFHDEAYFYLDLFKDLYSQLGGMIFHARPEQQLVEDNYPLDPGLKHEVLGEGVDTGFGYDRERFVKKYNIKEPFILYAGRKEAGKRVHVLLKYFSEYHKRNKTNLKLVLIGGGNIKIPNDVKKHVKDLGFVDIQDKYDAYGAATCLCQPSNSESFSLVIMESWLANRPVIVSGGCPVTKSFAIESKGGLYFDNYFDFEGAVRFLTGNPEIADEMGAAGNKFVNENFEWNVIVDKYTRFFQELIDRRGELDG
ncbi:MAG: glycosyltransferase family 4 protein [Erysipelotrichaceae bacterium]|nr:glycosyltransferase family 4 protein [Erysipelotrichaceae bacterium]